MVRRLGGMERITRAAIGSLVMAVLGAGTVSCGADDAAAPAPPADAGADVGAQDASVVDSPRETSTSDVHQSVGKAVMELSQTSIDFSLAACGGNPSGTQVLTVTNNGTAPLAVAAKTTGTEFEVSPTTLDVAPGKSGDLTVTVSIPVSAVAGTKVQGSLGLFTNDPVNTSASVALSAVPSGAYLTFAPNSPTSFAFPAGVVGSPVGPITVTLLNAGNGPGIFTVGGSPNGAFSVDEANLTNGVSAGTTWTLSAEFTPPDTTLIMGTLGITTTSPVCGASLTSIPMSGDGATGNLVGWPTTLDFGPADCGGLAPASQSFTLINTGLAAAHVAMVNVTGGFTTGATVGQTVAANGGSLSVQVTAPAVPNNSPLTPVTGTLTIQTDADTTPHSIALTEQPTGAVLAFDTKPTPNFGNFSSVALLKSATQFFNVTNSGTGSASVTLTVLPVSTGDGGVEDAGLTAASFSLSTAAFTVTAQGTAQSTQAETLTFTPQRAAPVTGRIALSTTSPVCGQLPTPIPVTGSGLGGGPTVGPTVLSFPATCGGAAPKAQTFLVANNGTADLTWSLSASAGVQLTTDADDAGEGGETGEAGAPDAATTPPTFAVTANPPPGLLIPGASSTVTVTGTDISSPASNLDAAAYQANVTITTDVPLDPPHVVTLSETPVGDQLSFSIAGPLRYGQIPVKTSIGQGLTITDHANPGSPPASVKLVAAGPGAAGYSVAQSPVASLAPGTTSATETVTFAPTAAMSYPATLVIQTSDALCTALPAPIVLSGTGTDGQVSVSASTLAFGTDPKDPAGLVNCGATGMPQTFTVKNLGNQLVHITELSLGLGASSPYSYSLPTGATLPLAMPIGSPSVTITVTPKAIPANVAKPSDPAPFTDTLTLKTDAVLDNPHPIKLVMQARGAVVADTPLATTWSFGTISFGSIGNFTSTIQDTGNDPLAISLTNLAEPSVFTLATQPTNAPGGNAITTIVGEFVPAASNGSWSDRGTLVVTPAHALCEPLPMQWSSPTINVSGASNSAPSVTIAGSLAFPSTNCGTAAPPAQGITLTNNTNVAYGYTFEFSSGKYYTSNPTVDAGSADAGMGTGTLAANGSASILVQPNTIVPAVGVTPGSAPYADNLVITIVKPTGDGGITPVLQFTVPISWTLNGAILTLPQGAGPNIDGMDHAYYPADSTGGLSLPMSNSGTATASVTLSPVSPGSFTYAPMGSVDVIPGLGAAPQLSSTSSDSACSGSDGGAPALTESTATFFYSGPVCQPFPLASVVVGACFGTFTGP